MVKSGRQNPTAKSITVDEALEFAFDVIDQRLDYKTITEEEWHLADGDDWEFLIGQLLLRAMRSNCKDGILHDAAWLLYYAKEWRRLAESQAADVGSVSHHLWTAAFRAGARYHSLKVREARARQTSKARVSRQGKFTDDQLAEATSKAGDGRGRRKRLRLLLGEKLGVSGQAVRNRERAIRISKAMEKVPEEDRAWLDPRFKIRKK